MSTNLSQAQANNILRQEVWKDRLLMMIKLETENFVFQKLGTELEVPKNKGTKTVSVRRYNSLPVTADLSAETLAEGVAPTPLKIEAQRVDALIAQYGAWIKITDWVADIHMDDVKSIYQPELARHAAEVRETIVMNSFSDASQYYVNNYTSIDDFDGSDASPKVLTLQDVRKVAVAMKNYRRKGHSKFNGLPVCVVHTNVMQDLLDDDVLTQKMLVPGNENTPIKNGTLQKYKAYGIMFIETLNAEVQLNENTTQPTYVYTSYLLGKDPYAVVKLGKKGLEWKVVTFEGDSNDPLGQTASFGYKMWGGAKVVDPLAIFKLYSVSNYHIVADFTSTYDAGGFDIEIDPLGDTASQA